MDKSASELVAQYGGVVKAALATGIPRTTLQSRLEQEAVARRRPAKELTIVQPAQPAKASVADIPDEVSNLKHLVIPDTQCRPGVPLDHLRWAGLYAVAKKPTSIVLLGDHWDMASLCSYDKGRRAAENMRYTKDIEAGNKGMELFMEPVLEEMARDPDWTPRLVFTMGNHEARIERASQDNPELEGTLSYSALDLDCYGWESHEFLAIADVDGVCYSHYFKPSASSKYPVTSARALLTKKHTSCIMGHVQKLDIATDYDARGKLITGLFAGCYYLHNDNYRDPQSNKATWRGLHVLYGVNDGEFGHNAIPIAYLRHRFSGQ